MYIIWNAETLKEDGDTELYNIMNREIFISDYDIVPIILKEQEAIETCFYLDLMNQYIIK